MVLKASRLAVGDEKGLESLVEELSVYLRQYAGWPHNAHLKAKVRTEIYKRMLPLIQPFDPQRANTIVDNLLKMQRITA